MKPEGVSLARTPFSSRGRSGRRRRLRGGMGLTAVRRARPRRELPGAGGKRHPPPRQALGQPPQSFSGRAGQVLGALHGHLKMAAAGDGSCGRSAGWPGGHRSQLPLGTAGRRREPAPAVAGRGRAGGVGLGGALCWAAAPGTGGKGDAGGRVMAPGAGGRVGCGPSLAAAACPAATRRAAPRADTPPPPSSSPASAFAASATAAGRGRCRRAGRSTSGRSPSARWPWTSTWAAWGCTARWRPRTLPASSEPSRSRWAAGRHRSRPRGAAPAPQALGGAGRAGGG